MNGSGVWTQTGNDIYTGATTVNAGTLNLSGTNTSRTAVVVNGGVLGDESRRTNSTGGVFTARRPALTLQAEGEAWTSSAQIHWDASSQTLGNINLTAGTVSGIAINPDGGGGTTLKLEVPTFTRGADSILDLDYTAGSGGVVATTTGALSGSGAPTGGNNIFGYMLVTDASGGTTGLGQLNGRNQIVRFDSTKGTTLTYSSNSATTDFTTLNTVLYRRSARLVQRRRSLSAPARSIR